MNLVLAILKRGGLLSLEGMWKLLWTTVIFLFVHVDTQIWVCAAIILCPSLLLC